MNWPTKYTQQGDIRTRRAFAFWPRDCSDERTRWLERIVLVQVFIGYCRYSDGWVTLWEGSPEQFKERDGLTPEEKQRVEKILNRHNKPKQKPTLVGGYLVEEPCEH